MGFDNDGHIHDDQLGEIYPTMLNELNCTFGVSFSRFHCCGHHGHGLWPSWFVTVMVCGRHGIGLSLSRTFHDRQVAMLREWTMDNNLSYVLTRITVYYLIQYDREHDKTWHYINVHEKADEHT